MIEESKLNCLGSDILKLEGAQTPMPKRIRIQSLITLCSTNISETDILKNLALKIYRKTELNQGMLCILHLLVWGKQNISSHAIAKLLEKQKKLKKI
jgi:hypothetical protein